MRISERVKKLETANPAGPAGMPFDCLFLVPLGNEDAETGGVAILCDAGATNESVTQNDNETRAEFRARVQAIIEERKKDHEA